MTDGFTVDHLRSLLTMGGRSVFWRHDVDFSPSCAIEMAKLEFGMGMGLRSVFYLRVDGEEYSLMDMALCAAEIAEYGHQIGVHVSLDLPRTARPTEALLAARCSAAFSVAQGAFGMTTRKVSLHAPPHAARWRTISGFEHAMAPCWKGYYLGDSRGVFSENPEAFLLLDRPLQVNFHPEWWFLPENQKEELREQEALKP